MAIHKENPQAWMATPQFGGWDQKTGQAPNYSMVFSRARANRKEHKSDVKRGSFGNEHELIIPKYRQHDELSQKKRKSLFRYFSCCYVPESEFEKISRV